MLTAYNVDLYRPKKIVASFLVSLYDYDEIKTAEFPDLGGKQLIMELKGQISFRADYYSHKHTLTIMIVTAIMRVYKN